VLANISDLQLFMIELRSQPGSGHQKLNIQVVQAASMAEDTAEETATVHQIGKVDLKYTGFGSLLSSHNAALGCFDRYFQTSESVVASSRQL